MPLNDPLQGQWALYNTPAQTTTTTYWNLAGGRIGIRGEHEPNSGPWIESARDASDWMLIRKSDENGYAYTLFELRKDEVAEVAKVLMGWAIEDGLNKREGEDV